MKKKLKGWAKFDAEFPHAFPEYSGVEKNRRRQTKQFSYVGDRKSTNMDWETCKEFYTSWEWKKCRDEWLENKEKKCKKCGRIPDPNYRRVKPDRNRPQWEKDKLAYEFQSNRILVDHRLPIKYYWHLRLTPSNFQMLCGVCNEEKLNKVSSKYLKEVNNTGLVNTEEGVKPLEIIKVVKK